MPLSRERIRRYEDKISFIIEDLEWLNKWLPADEEEFIADVKTRKAIYKLVQEITDCIMDLVAMMIKDEGRTVQDDYSNLIRMRELGIINVKLEKGLRELDGLRNVLVHRYNGIDDRLAFRSIMGLEDTICEFLKVIKSWLKEKSSKR